MKPVQLASLLFIGLLILYLLSCLYSGHMKRINLKLASYYVVLTSILGVAGELIVDGSYKFFAGRPLWVYRVYPIHGGFTSKYSFFIWGAMGFQIYLFHEILFRKKAPHRVVLAMVLAAEAVIIESLFDLMSLSLFGKYVYYYLPSNLWHVTSLQVLPLYLITGYAYLYILKTLSPSNLEYSRIAHR